MDLRYVYILQRVTKTKVIILLALPVLNARRIEKILHEKFADSHIKDIRKEPFNKWYQLQDRIKIGIAKDPKKRVENINESNLSSGYTEFFRVTSLELGFIIGWLWWYFLKPYLIGGVLITGAIYLI